MRSDDQKMIQRQIARGHVLDRQDVVAIFDNRIATFGARRRKRVAGRSEVIVRQGHPVVQRAVYGEVGDEIDPGIGIEEEYVRTGAAEEDVLTGLAFQVVVTVEAEDRVVAGRAVDVVGPGRADDVIGAWLDGRDDGIRRRCVVDRR